MSVQFYVHSDYSLLESVLTVEALVAKAQQLGIETLALTDHNTTAGHVEFERSCKRAGIKAIFGLELDVSYSTRDEYRSMVVLAVTSEGYSNLLCLASQPTPVAYQLLPDFKAGLAFLEGGKRGRITHLLQEGKTREAGNLHAWYQKNFGPAYYLRYELGQDQTLFESFPNQQFILCQDVRYAEADHRPALDVLGKMSGMEFSLSANPLLSWEELINQFAGPASVVATTLELAASCEVTLPRERILPPHPAGESLQDLLWQGAKLRYGELTDPVRKRLHYELSMIEDLGFSDYFLIVADIVRYAKGAKIPVGPGRGSAASSLVAYCLGITEIDPLRWGLLFERFLNSARQNRPDIDLDFCYERRGEVLRYVVQRFGQEHVAQIGTYGTFGPRSAQQEVRRSLGRDNQALASQIRGLKRHRSTHAAGVIITAEPIQKLSAVYLDREIPVTHLDMYSLEELGVLKIDLLGLRTLTLLERIEKEVQKREPSFVLAQIPLADQATYKMLGQGKSLGIFQLESSLFQDLLRAMQPQSFADLVALLALGRPGPLNIFPEYLKRRQNPAKVPYLHADLREILGETYGLILYQEQVMLIAHRIGGLSLGEADLLRSALGKNDHGATRMWQKRFMAGAHERTGLSKEEVERLFKMIAQFSGYAFNKAHSVSYAFISWQAAYLKARYPGEFFATLLNEGSSGKERSAYLLEGQSLGLKILPPSVLYSKARASLEGRDLRLGLTTTRQVSPQSAQEILQGRTRQTWSSLSSLRNEVKLDERTLESLILCGALDDLGERNQHLRNLGLESKRELELLRLERDLVGVYASKHPSTPFLPLVRNLQGDLDVVVGEILEIKRAGNNVQGILDTPQGALFFQGSSILTQRGLNPGDALALFGGWEQGLWQIEWALSLGPTLLITPSSEDLEIIKTILQGETGSKPVVLRLGEGAAYHLLPGEFWVRDLKRVERELRAAQVVFTWFDPWKENDSEKGFFEH